MAPRLLLLSHDLSLSGAPLLLARLCERLRAPGYIVTVVAAEDGPARDLCEAAGATVLVMPALGHLMINVAPLAGLVKDHDLIIANTLVNWRGVHLARAFGKPSVLWVHEFSYGRQIALEHQPVAAALTQADHVVLPARRLLELYGNFVRDGHYSVVPYGIDDAVLEVGDDARPQPAAGRLRIVHVGSVEPRKGQDLLLRALSMLNPEGSQSLEVFFVGRILRPDFMAELQPLAERMPYVHFTGELSPARAIGFMASAEIFVLSSRDEVLPLSMLEAMALGKAVIATDVGGVREAIQSGLNGIVIGVDDVAALANALNELVSSPELRRSLGRRARATFLECFTGERFAKSFLAVVARTLGAPNRPTEAQPLAWRHG
jgi:O-antigen biosynthesis protein